MSDVDASPIAVRNRRVKAGQVPAQYAAAEWEDVQFLQICHSSAYLECNRTLSINSTGANPSARFSFGRI